MKFDIVRAWKDESYRQRLSDEQLGQLPAHPAGDLTEAELASVAGGALGGLGGFADGLGGAGSDVHLHSFTGVTCDVNAFSAATITLPGVASILNTFTHICANGE
jgi:mersacidin/lichenicidin family type 2 lantibiotic